MSLMTIDTLFQSKYDKIVKNICQNSIRNFIITFLALSYLI